MSEYLPQPDLECERIAALGCIIAEYFPEDAELFAAMDAQDMLGTVYGQLLVMGEDPDEILEAFGVTEGEN